MYERLCGALEKVSNALLVTLIAAIVALTLANVAMRYVFTTSVTGADQLSRMMFVWTTFLGAATLYRHHGHIAVEYFVDRMPHVLRSASRWITEVLLLSFFMIMLVYGTDLTIDTSTQVTGALGVSPAFIYAAAPASAALLVLYWVEKNVYPRNTPPPLPTDVGEPTESGIQSR